MKIYQTDQIRNVSLLGNSGSGKTTLAEAILFESGLITRRGDIASKNTVSDFNRVEHEYGYSVFSSVIYAECQKKKLNIIDNPGSDDFINGAVTALNVTESALMLVNAGQGVEVGTENLFRYTEALKKPVIFVVNHLDHEKTNFDGTIENIHESFGKKAIIVQYPVNPGLEFNAIIDLLKMKMLKWSATGGEAQILDIPDSEKAKAEDLRNALIEAAAENDESLMEQFFESGELNEEEIQKGIKLGLKTRNMFPILSVSAAKNMGVKNLMEFIAENAPGVTEMPYPKTIRDEEVTPDPNGTPNLFIFKTSIEPHIGEISYFKVMSGKITEGMDLFNTTNRDAKERLAQLFYVYGNTRLKVTELVAGDIGATVKLKESKTGHTLNAKGVDFEFSPISYPNSKFRTAIKPASEGDEEKMGEILSRMHEEDPTIKIEYSKELKQVIVHGQGEFHLTTMKWRMENIDKLAVEFINPKIPYRETITKQARADYRHKKQSGGAGQFGEVHMVIEPYYEGMPAPTTYKFGGQEYKMSVRDTKEIDLAWGGKMIFCNCIVGGVIDTRFLPAIEKGIMEKMEEGPLTGSYARDIRICVYDGKMHTVDSNEISFKLAGRNAFRLAFKDAGPKILEPIYDIEVRVPSDRMGDVMGDLQTRRAMIEGMNSEKGFEIIKAKVPLKEMNKYSTSLSSISGGRAFYSMSFSKYEKVPPEIQEQLLAAYEAEQKEE